jgi:hypothetical protein
MESLATTQQHKAADGSLGAPLLQMQATLLVHISTFLKYDSGLATEWHKHFKSGGLTGSPFMLQVRRQVQACWVEELLLDLPDCVDMK